MIALGIIFSIVLILAALFCTAFFWVKLIFGANAVVQNASVFDSIKAGNYQRDISGIALIFYGLSSVLCIGNMLTAASMFVSVVTMPFCVALPFKYFHCFLYPYNYLLPSPLLT